MSDTFIDPVVTEIHASRAAMLKAAGGDIDVLMQQVADRQQLSNRRIIRESLRNREKAADGPEPASGVALGMG